MEILLTIDSGRHIGMRTEQEILKDFEDRYKWKKSQKGDLLIKTKYRKRSVI